MKPILRTFRFFLLFTAIGVITTNCGNYGSGTDYSGTGRAQMSGSSGSSTLGSLLGSGSGNTSPLSLGSGNLANADTLALQNLNQAMQTPMVAPTQPFALPSALSQQMQQLVQQQLQGQNVQVQMMALAGQMLQVCANRIAVLAPAPIQPALGSWGADACDPRILTVTGSGSDGVIQNNGANGAIHANGSGGLVIQGDWSGMGSDTPGPAAADLSGNVVSHTKNGDVTSPKNCHFRVVASTNPIPANYAEGMKRAIQCFRQTLVMTSPLFQQMFSQMNPALVQALEGQLLGIR